MLLFALALLLFEDVHHHAFKLIAVSIERGVLQEIYDVDTSLNKELQVKNCALFLSFNLVVDSWV